MKRFKIVKDNKIKKDAQVSITTGMSCTIFKDAVEKDLHFTYKVGDLLPIEYFSTKEEAFAHIQTYGNPRDEYTVYELEYDKETLLNKFKEDDNCVKVALEIMDDPNLLKFNEIETVKLVQAKDSFEEIKKIAEDQPNKPLKKKAVNFDPKKLCREKYLTDECKTEDADEKAEKLAEAKASYLIGKGKPFIISTVPNACYADDEDAFIDLETAKEFVDRQDYKMYVNEISKEDGKIVCKTVYENKAEAKDEAIKYYIYLDNPSGRELIGIANSEEEAKKIKAEKDKEWKTGDYWNTFISTKELEEISMYDSFEEIDKGMKKPNGKPLKKTEVEIDPKKIQRQNALVEDSRDFIGEENDHFNYRSICWFW